MTRDTQQRGRERGRGQANLLALVTALVALTTVTVLGVAVATGALAGQDRAAGERHAATALSERLVSAESPLTRRPNVLDASALPGITAVTLTGKYPILAGRAFAVRLGERVLAKRGSPAGGTTIRRIVLVERTGRETVEPRFGAGNHLTLPRRTPRVRLGLDPPANVTIHAVRANGRTVLRDAGGLRGFYTVEVPRHETVTLAFSASDDLDQGDVTVRLFPRETTKAHLVVTVDD